MKIHVLSMLAKGVETINKQTAKWLTAMNTNTMV